MTTDSELTGSFQRIGEIDDEGCPDKFADSTLTQPTAPDVLIGQHFDDYQILSRLGGGGMGEVYRAKQISTGREVAVKLVGHNVVSGGSDRRLVERFQKEIESTACLKHDRIVKAFAAGEFRGRLYYAMELVLGRSLQELLAVGRSGTLQPLPAHSAARYLATCADAIQHAHAHKILHRDLKPQNILLEDATDQPYVMDFGLATQMQDGRSQSTLGGPVGTPGFMAPEQALAEPCSVATDVYGLGATLYALLVARPPFQAGSPAETQRLVLHEQPVNPRRLNPGVPRDLEAIVLKCLEKTPRHRYGTAAALRDDLHRFLDGRPTVARPIGPLKRFGRWCRREPRTAGLTLAILAVLAATGIAAGVVAEKRRGLLAERENLLQDLQQSFEAQTHSTARAVANFSRANQAVADLQAVAARTDIDLQLRQELLSQIDGYLRAFLEDSAGDPQLQRQRAAALLRRGQIALQIRSPREAIEPYQTAAVLFQELFGQYPDDLQLLRNLAGVHQGLATAYSLAGRSELALQATLASRNRFQSLTQRQPGNVQFQHDYARLLINLGVVHVDRGEFAEASAAYQSAERILTAFPSRTAELESSKGDGQEHRRLADIRSERAKLHLNLAALANKTGDLSQAREENDKALALLTEMLQEDHGDEDASHDMALALTNAGLAARRSEMLDEAERHFRQAAELAESLQRKHPQLLIYQDTATNVQRQLGQLLQAAGRFDEAAEHFERAAVIGQNLLEARSSASAAFLNELIQTYRSLGRVHQQADRQEQMQAAWEAGSALCRQVLAHHPDQVEFAISLGMFYRDLGSAAERRSDLPQAAGWAEQAVTLLQPLVERQPEERFAARLLLENLLQYAGHLDALDRSAEAIASWEQAILVYPRAQRAPSDGKTTADLLLLARVGLAESLRVLEDADRVAQQAELIAAENTDIHSHFTAAQYFALAARMVEEAAEQAAAADSEVPNRSVRSWYDAAMRHLHQADETGYFTSPENRLALYQESAFQPLRVRPAFQELLQRIENLAADGQDREASDPPR